MKIQFANKGIEYIDSLYLKPNLLSTLKIFDINFENKKSPIIRRSLIISLLVKN